MEYPLVRHLERGAYGQPYGGAFRSEFVIGPPVELSGGVDEPEFEDVWECDEPSSVSGEFECGEADHSECE